MSKIRVIIIEQQETKLKRLINLLSESSHIDIIGFASCRKKGCQLIETLKPDLALIDIFFIKEIDWESSSLKSLPVLLLARPLVDEVAKTIRAISLGAIDFINKQDLSKQGFKNELIFKIEKAFKRRKSKQFIKNNQAEQSADSGYIEENKQYKMTSEMKINKNQQTVVAIGTSTGGPKALQKVLEKFPENFSAPIFIVQHMPSGFTKSLAKRLNYSTNLKIKEATNNDVVKRGTVYIAPGNYHMTVSKSGNRLITHIDQKDLHQGHRPSVDVLFSSIATLKNVNKIAVVLTGMGKDGAEGVRAIREKNKSALIIAESKESAVIFGMPQAALQTDCVTNVAHIDEIGTMIKDYVER